MASECARVLAHRVLAHHALTPTLTPAHTHTHALTSTPTLTPTHAHTHIQSARTLEGESWRRSHSGTEVSRDKGLRRESSPETAPSPGRWEILVSTSAVWSRGPASSRHGEDGYEPGVSEPDVRLLGEACDGPAGVSPPRRAAPGAGAGGARTRREDVRVESDVQAVGISVRSPASHR